MYAFFVVNFLRAEHEFIVHLNCSLADYLVLALVLMLDGNSEHVAHA